MDKLFYIDYPQESFEGQAHRYRCAFCKEETTKINGSLEGHLSTCEYRTQLETSGFEAHPEVAHEAHKAVDDFD